MSLKKSGRSAGSPDSEACLLAYRRRMSCPPIVRVQNKTEWQQRRAVVREKTLQALGLQPMPDRLPLDLKSGGAVERDGYRAERIYWQTWPGVFTGGWLYTPAQGEGAAPAILLLHGLRELATEASEVHAELARLALLGYVALAADADYLPRQELPVGFTAGSVMAVGNLRALDLLAGRPDVDRQRIGLAALASATAEALHLLALDDRIRASVLSLYDGLGLDGPHQPGPTPPYMDLPGLLSFTNGPELCAVSSPRALLFITPEGEAAARFREGEWRELRAYYHLWQQPDRLAHIGLGDGALASEPARKAMYTWFERELRGHRAPETLRDPAPELAAAPIHVELSPPPVGYHDVDAIVRWYGKRVVDQPPQLEGKPARRSYQERVSAELRDLLGLPTHDCPLRSITTPTPPRPFGESGSPPNAPRPSPIALSFQSEPDVRVPALWLSGTGDAPWPVLLAVHPEGKEAALNTELVRSFRAAGYAVLAPDVRFRGELQADWSRETLLWGRPEAGMAVTDIHACVRWLLGEEGIDARGIVLWGDGDQGVAAMLAAGLDERITATVADCRSTTYRDGGEGLPLIPNILRVADVPQIASMIATRPLWLYQVPEDRVGFSSRRYYDWTRRSFQSLGDVDALKMSTKSLPDPPALLDWLKIRLKRARR